ncbi:hypothetical protein D3C72_1260880 [compost metagenome]
MQGQLAQGFAAGRGQRGHDLQAVARFVAQRPVVAQVVLGKAQQRVAGQLFRRGRFAMARQVGGRGQHVQRAGSQGARMQGRIDQGADADGDIGAVLEQVGDLVVAGQLQADVRIHGAKFGHVRHHAMEHEGRGGIDAQAPGRFLAADADRFFHVFHRGEDGAGLFQEQLALFRQLHAPCRARQQRGGQLVFQP